MQPTLKSLAVIILIALPLLAMSQITPRSVNVTDNGEKCTHNINCTSGYCSLAAGMCASACRVDQT